MVIETADVVVVGLGAVGSATLHHLASGGVRAVGIDRFHPPHDRGSSHGESRITRLAVGEGAAYARLARRSHAIWHELEQRTGETLFLPTGCLVIGPPDGAAHHHGQDDFVRRTIASAREAGVGHEVLDAGTIASRFPQLALRGDEMGCFEPGAGVLFPERCVAVQFRLARDHGAILHLGETVLSIDQAGRGVEVVTDRRILHAARAVVSAGPWIPALVGGRVAELTRVHRQTLHWFALDGSRSYAPDRFPAFVWMHGDDGRDLFYGFPSLPGAGPPTIKLATERYAAAIEPEEAAREAAAEESATLYARHVAGRLRGVRPTCLRTAACSYTVTPDAGFIVDALPGRPDVLVASACSGHGFKHSAALGELLAERSLASVPPDADAFGLARFDAASAA